MGAEIRRKFKPRQWQIDALAAYKRLGQKDFLANITPGGGKTIFALTAANVTPEVERIVVVGPTIQVKGQWKQEGTEFGMKFGDIAEGTPSVVTTYAQVALNPEPFAAMMAEQKTLVIFDEIHHAADKKPWGDSLRQAFDGAHRRLLLTGTAFRSDDNSIPYVGYKDGQSTADYSYGYGEAYRDGVVRLIEFKSRGGKVGWSHRGKKYLHSFEEALKPSIAAQRLRAATDPAHGFMQSILTDAQHTLAGFPGDGGLVIARTCDHADAIAKQLLAQTGKMPIVVHTKDGESGAASKKIARFAAGEGDWLVSVQMVSEGADIPRLRVLVYATNITTELFFRQALGRIVRGNDGMAYCYFPAHPEFIARAEKFHEERMHTLSGKVPDGEPSTVGGGGTSREEIEVLFGEGWEDRCFRVPVESKWSTESEVCKELSEKSSENNARRLKRWKEANKDKAAEHRRRWREGNKNKTAEYARHWNEANKERLAEKARRYNEANKERLAEKRRIYREANKERLAYKRRIKRLAAKQVKAGEAANEG